MTHVETHHVHARVSQRKQGVSGVGGGADSGNDLGLFAGKAGAAPWRLRPARGGQRHRRAGMAGAGGGVGCHGGRDAGSHSPASRLPRRARSALLSTCRARSALLSTSQAAPSQRAGSVRLHCGGWCVQICESLWKIMLFAQDTAVRSGYCPSGALPTGRAESKFWLAIAQLS